MKARRTGGFARACGVAGGLVLAGPAYPVNYWITLLAGNGTDGYGGDGGPATAASLSYPMGEAVDGAGNVFIADSFNNRVRKVSSSGIVTTVAGNGVYGPWGDGGPATSASLAEPEDVAVDGAGNLYIADTYNNRVRKVDPAGVITTLAGDGVYGYWGDGGAAVSAELAYPAGIAVDPAGNVFIADMYNNRIRKVSPAGIITTIAGNGGYGYSGDGGAAVSATLRHPMGVGVDAAGNVYIADTYNCRIRRVNTAGIITTIAGDGINGYWGDGGPATLAELGYVCGLAVDGAGNGYLADTYNNRIRRVSTAGIITTIAGTGAYGYSGDGGPAGSARLYGPAGVDVDGGGAVYVGDTENNRVRKMILVGAELAVSLAVVPNSPPVGQWAEIVATVTNSGSAAASGLTVALGFPYGGSNVAYESGPSPAGPVTLNPGASQSFTWTYSVSGNGAARVDVSATGVDALSGMAMTCIASGYLRVVNILVFDSARVYSDRYLAIPGTVATVWNEATWSSRSTADFSAFDAIVIGGERCSVSGDASLWNTPVANRNTWGAAVTGNIAVIGTDPSCHESGNPCAGDLIDQAVLFAATDAIPGPGLVVIADAYQPVGPIPLALMGYFGTFTVNTAGCGNKGHVIAQHPILATITDECISNWSCSTHMGFDSWPEGFRPLALATDAPTRPYTAGDGTQGLVYMIATGVKPVWGLPQLVKVVSPVAAVPAGGLLTYEVAWRNGGAATTNNLALTDTLPNGSAYVSPSLGFWAQSDAAGSPALSSAAWAVNPGGPWTPGEPPDGTAGPLLLRWVVDRVTPDFSGFLRFQVRVSATLAEGSVVTNSVSATQQFDSAVYRGLPVSVSVTGLTVSVTKTPSGWVLPSSGTVTYTIAFVNISAGTATNVTVWDTVPAGLSFVSATSGGAVAGGIVSWTLPDLPPGGAGSVELTADVDGTEPYMGPNRAALGCANEAMVPQRPFTSNPVTVRLSAPVLGVTKRANPAAAPVGAEVTYEIAIANSGEDTAVAVVLWDTVPEGCSYVSCAAPSGGACTGPGPVVAWSLPDIPPQASAYATMTVRISSTAPAIGPNVAEVSYANSGLVPLPDSSSNPVAVAVLRPALTVAKTPGRSPASDGGLLAYSIAVRNAGDETAANLAVFDTLPAGASYESCTAPPGGSCAWDGTRLEWSLPDLGPGASAALAVTVRTTGAGTNVGPNRALAQGTNSLGWDPFTALSDAVTVPVVDALLTVTKTASPAPVPEDSVLVYRLVVRNAGGDTAVAVTVWDSLPAGAVFVGCGGGATCWRDGTRVEWRLPGISPGGSAVLTASVTATGALGCPNMAQAGYANSATVWRPVVSSNAVCVPVVQAVLAIKITADRPVHSAGEPVAYSIVVSSTGSDTAIGVVVEDAVPADVSFYSSTPSGSVVPGGRTWSLPALGPGATSTVYVSVLPPLATCLADSFPYSAFARYSNSAGIPRPGITDGPVYVSVTGAALSVGVSPAATVVQQAGKVVFTVVWSNPCTDTAWNVTLWDSLPAGAVYLASTGGGVRAGGVVAWNPGTVPPGAGGSVTFAVSITGDGPEVSPWIAEAAHTGGAGLAGRAMSNQALVTVLSPAVTVEKQGPSGPVTGGRADYVLTVRNAGTDTAFAVTVVDSLPPPFVYDGATPAATVTGAILAWTVTRLGIGETVVIEVGARDPSGESDGEPVNCATASWLSALGFARSSAPSCVTVVLSPNLVIRIFPNPYEPARAVRGTLKVTGLPAGSAVHFFTVAGVQVRRLSSGSSHRVEWDGRNESGSPCAAGLYLYAVEINEANRGMRWVRGKVGLIR